MAEKNQKQNLKVYADEETHMLLKIGAAKNKSSIKKYVAKLAKENTQ